MSSEAGMNFGSKHHEKYAKIIDTWSNKDISKVTDKLEGKWGEDLLEALADPLIEELTSNDSLRQWSKAADLPSKEVLSMYSKIAVKYSLAHASTDLLRRLVISVKNDRSNPPETVTAAARVVRPSELAARSPQTVAQIFDMAKDQFNSLLGKYFYKKNQFTGRRQWITADKNSRHKALNGVIADPDEAFTYKKQEIHGPRPVGGNPADWSNCSCRLKYERTNGKWVDVTD